MGRYYSRNYYRNYDDYDDYDEDDFYYGNSYYDNGAEGLIKGAVLLGFFYLFGSYYTNRPAFWHAIFYIIGTIVLLLAIYIGIRVFKSRRRAKIVGELKWVNNDISQMVQEAKEDIPKVTNAPTPQALALHKALLDRGIKNELEKSDGFKHVDIAITWARLNIEIDGYQHYLDSMQVKADYKRAYYSMRKGYKTIRFPNFVIDKYLDRVADTVAKVARDEYFRNS
ncbi:MAG: DUF559 domain-containing protein [Candidatus Magasanikbacteria bacterium]|nr:DUF559 domain-containing protein [Candidatus Magasanikbacteria bacterium]